MQNLFADDISLFTIIDDPNATAEQVCEDFNKINEWAFQQKMSFNPDSYKQAQVIFTPKNKKNCTPTNVL